MKHHLYRHFNTAGDLLYVGISLSALHRLGQHSQNSRWFDAIASVTIQNFDTRPQAAQAERTAIQEERPKYNIAHQPRADALTLVASGSLKPDESRDDLVRRVVFQPVYTIAEAAKALSMGESLVRQCIASGELGWIEVPSSGAAVRRRITGWQLLDFLEHWEAKSGKRAAA